MQMKDVIRRKRKELDLTQEQMAEYLACRLLLSISGRAAPHTRTSLSSPPWPGF